MSTFHLLILLSFLSALSVAQDSIYTPVVTEITTPVTMSDREAYITNYRYMNWDLIWGRPKGLLFGDIPGAGPEQKANLYPDKAATYNVANIRLPSGASLVLKGQYPHARYLSFTIANQLDGGNGQLGGGVFLRGDQIIPDAGNQNPFWPEDGRDVSARNYTVFVVQGSPPLTGPVQNTLYTGTTSETDRVHFSIRTYLADRGYDGTGVIALNGTGNGLPEVTLVLSNGMNVTGPKLIKMLDAIKTGDPSGYTLDHWLYDIGKSKDPVNAPALPTPYAQVFWNTDYSVTGSFEAMDPEKRVRDHPANTNGGFANNPDTKYMIIVYSFKYDDVVVVRGRMPTHPKTRQGTDTLPSKTPMVQYFSASTAAAPSYGAGWDTACDEQIPVDEFGNYTIVVSWPWNRPAFATLEHGVTWLSPGGGEGNFVGARNWVGLIYFRFQNCDPDWEHSPWNIPLPTPENPIPQDRRVMGPYYPVAEYASSDWTPEHIGPSGDDILPPKPL
mmetsp:Transcript_29405/g.45456  ORF Transcript_29405/g.45456 Transcript_29405/m.45456 type:complete len:500 (-) Transcript_29405:97-1596(-)|eukprot:CAMPEP_0201522284 /NCGR_PEP_ID=MMETSP0161_2-20130828/16729_1 /ASSEMBLY_ACC=CAM_ASM_000251 /TAXON_ID=180227 /ORGANISM="Neoparamoeba aestuarina, Strain SoJaBio B1-5/56/2" /LENGTH=499 /DNA_ID=CAMNT_0047921077 /DNA_START=120 /DNA_END=1619 /DNA_ORIENTATION=+